MAKMKWTEKELAALCAMVEGSVGDTVRRAQDALCRLCLCRTRQRVWDKQREGATRPAMYPQSLGELCLAEVERHNRHESWPVEWYLFLWGQEGTVSADGNSWQRDLWAFPISIMPDGIAALRSALYHRPRDPEPAAMPGLKETAAICEKLRRTE